MNYSYQNHSRGEWNVKADVIGTNLELYKIFYITAKSGNITSAAEKLYLTQPSVTKYIQKLEKQLCCELFVRSKRGVTLTAEGELLMSRIEPAWQLIASAEREIASMQSLETGSVSIASTEMSFKSYVLPAMKDFMEKHPGITVKFSNALNERMIELLHNGSIDIAILHEPFKVYDFMDIRVIDEMNEYAVCGLQYKEAVTKRLSPQELCSYPFISMPQGSSTMEYLLSYFSDFGIEFKPDIELTTVELTVQAVESGLGIGILPERIVLPRLNQGRILQIPLVHPLPKRKACLITNSKMPLSIAAKSFIDDLILSMK